MIQEIREDLKVQLKLLKNMLKRMEKNQNLVKKVEEYNQLSFEMIKIENSIKLIETTTWILKDEKQS